MEIRARRVLGGIGIGLLVATAIALIGELSAPSHSVVSTENLSLSVVLGF